MLIWMIITIILALLGVVELALNFGLPFIELRVVLLFLLILGMAYRMYVMERTGEKEILERQIRELEEKLAAISN